MRQTGPATSETHRWSTPIGLVTCGWVFTAAAAAWWWTTGTGSDRLFVGLLVLVLAAVCTFASVCRPRLSATEHHVTVRGLRGRRQWPWSNVTVRAVRNQRLGRTVETLELDVPDDEGGLLVFGKLDLGEDPLDVAETLTKLKQ